MYSTSVVDSAITDQNLDFQLIVLLSIDNAWPVVDLLLSISTVKSKSTNPMHSKPIES